MQQTVLRHTAGQRLRQCVTAPLALAVAGYLLYKGVDRFVNGEGGQISLIFGLACGYLGLMQVVAAFSAVRYDDRGLSWQGMRLIRYRYKWSDIAHVDMVRTGRRGGKVRVRVHHRSGDRFDLPVLSGGTDSRGDPHFEAKAAHLMATWQESGSA